MAPRKKTTTVIRTAPLKSAPEKQSSNIIYPDELAEEMRLTLESGPVQVKVHISPKKRSQLASQIELDQLHDSETEAGEMTMVDIDILAQSLQLEGPLRLQALQANGLAGLETLRMAAKNHVDMLDARIRAMTLFELLERYGGNLEEAILANVVAGNGPNPTAGDDQTTRTRKRALASPLPGASSSKTQDHFGNKKVKSATSPSTRRPTTSRGVTASASKAKLKPTPSKRAPSTRARATPSPSTTFLPPSTSFDYRPSTEPPLYETEFAKALENLKNSMRGRPIEERLIFGERYGIDLA